MGYILPEDYVIGTLAGLSTANRGRGNPGTKSRASYVDVICTFDIETTRIIEIEQSVMYVWMLHLHHHCTIVGRTWDELDYLLDIFSQELGERTLVIYVHNLSYEFQFLRALWEWNTEDVFAVKSRKVLKASAKDGRLEFRCSYLHSNMSLSQYTRKWNVEHAKLSGEEFDYTKARYPWTPLTESEIAYCLHDVIGLAEALEKEMQSDNDNLYTIPLTSTGYVRRDAKEAMRKVNHHFVKEQLPDYEIYEMLREAFRGGNTHANRHYAGHILNNVKSFDRSSSYPGVCVNCKFPVKPFYKVKDDKEKTFENVVKLVTVREKALLMRISFEKIELRDENWGCPYLTRDKARRIENGVFDNGRVLSADYLETTVTDIDFKIIVDEYKAERVTIIDMAYSTYGKLPSTLIEMVNNYFRQKTELKGVEGQEVYYMKSKNRLNSIYGMMAQNPVKQETFFVDGVWNPLLDGETKEEYKQKMKEREPELLEEHNKKAFLAYQWGVWVTAHARQALEEGIKIAGDGFVYCDTDSVKYIGEADFSKYNSLKIKESKANGAFATDCKGGVHYMEVYEEDGVYNTFKTLGAKKYAYTYAPGGETHVTIAGVTKSKGGKELDKAADRFNSQLPPGAKKVTGLHMFKDGFVFREAGGTESIFNDFPEVAPLEIDGNTLAIAPNIVIKDSEYTLGITQEYYNLIKYGELGLDNWA